MKTNETKWRQRREHRTTCLVREAGPKSKRGCSISLSGPLSDCSANQCGSPPPSFPPPFSFKVRPKYQSALAYIATEGQGEALCRLHWLRFSCFGFAIRGRRRREKVSGRGGDLPFFLATPVCSELKCIQLDGGLRAELSCFCSA